MTPVGAKKLRLASRLLAALMLGGLSSVALAQIVPPSEQPGRERQRFEQQSPVLARQANVEQSEAETSHYLVDVGL